MKGTLPNSGIVEIKNNKLKFINILLNSKKYYVLATQLEDNYESGLSIGDKYTYKVNYEETFNFYILSFNDDNTVNLIMDRNICGYPDETNSNNGKPTAEGRTCLIEWYDQANDNRKGPITIMKGLYNATKNWINVPDMILSYDDVEDKRITGYSGNIEYGYTGIFTDVDSKVTTIVGKNITERENFGNTEFPLKARLPKYSEIYISDSKHCATWEGSCSVWLVDNLEYNNAYSSSTFPNKGNITNIYGYWLLSSHPNYSGVYIVSHSGSIGENYTTTKYDGIRPVITVPREYLE